MPNNVPCTNAQVLKYDNASGRWVCGNDFGSELFLLEDDTNYYLSVDNVEFVTIGKAAGTSVTDNSYNVIDFYNDNSIPGYNMLVLERFGMPSLSAVLSDNNNYITGMDIVDNGDGTDTITLNRNGLSDLSYSLTDNNNYITGMEFSSGSLSMSRNGMSDVSINLDGRYSYYHMIIMTFMSHYWQQQIIQCS